MYHFMRVVQRMDGWGVSSAPRGKPIVATRAPLGPSPLLQSKAVLDAARSSMGMDISAHDLANVELFTTRLVSLAQYRQQLFTYLQSKMAAVAPNLGALIGEVVGARLISHAGEAGQQSDARARVCMCVCAGCRLPGHPPLLRDAAC